MTLSVARIRSVDRLVGSTATHQHEKMKMLSVKRKNHALLTFVVWLLARFQISDWFGAAKKTLLSNANKLLLDMQEFDKDNIPDKVIAVSEENKLRHSQEIMSPLVRRK